MKNFTYKIKALICFFLFGNILFTVYSQQLITNGDFVNLTGYHLNLTGSNGPPVHNHGSSVHVNANVMTARHFQSPAPGNYIEVTTPEFLLTAGSFYRFHVPGSSCLKNETNNTYQNLASTSRIVDLLDVNGNIIQSSIISTPSCDQLGPTGSGTSNSIFINNLGLYTLKFRFTDERTSSNFTQIHDLNSIAIELLGNNNRTVNINTQFDFGNNNCVSSSYGIPYPVTLSDGTNTASLHGSVRSNGILRLGLGNGSYTITPNSNSLFTSSIASNSFMFPGDPSPHNINFCFSKSSSNPKLEVKIVPITNATINRPGFNSFYKVIITNIGNETHSLGTFNFQYDNNLMDFVFASSNSSNYSPSIPTGIITWNLPSISPFQTIEETVIFTLNTPTHPTHPLMQGDVLTFSSDLIDNSHNSHDTFTLSQTVVNSYDPNDKTCLQGDTAESSIIGEYVDYVIRFENLGNADAINVKIFDDIDTSKFDINTLTPISSSHNFRTEIRNNRVEFIFDNINLPPSPSAPAQPIIGYVAFKIKTLGTLSVGDTFNNQANIFFDFNSPIVTNDFETVITQVLSTNEKEFLKAELFPNPAVDYIQLKTKEAIDKILIYDINGRLVQTALHPDKEFDVSRLNKGVYMLQIFSGEKQISKKLIKQ